MWFIDNFDIRTVQLDFSSSWGGHPRSRSLFSGDTQLVNATDFADLSADPVQVHVCEHCGEVGCAIGGYVRFRRVGEFCIWLPDFSKMFANDWEAREFEAPSYVEDRGVPFLHCDTYSALQSELTRFPRFENIRPLCAPDAARLLQWDAPSAVFEPAASRPTLNTARILAVTSGDTEQECAAFQCLLNSFMDHEESPVDTAANGQPVEFHLDGPPFPSWTPMRRHGGFCSLQLESRLAVRLTA